MQKRLLDSAFIVALIWLGLRFLYISFVPLGLFIIIKYITADPLVIERLTHYSIVPFFMVNSFIVGCIYAYDTHQKLHAYMRLKIIFFIVLAEWLYRMNSFTTYIRLMVAQFWHYFDHDHALLSSKELFDAILFYSVLVFSAYIFLSLGSKCYNYFYLSDES